MTTTPAPAATADRPAPVADQARTSVPGAGGRTVGLFGRRYRLVGPRWRDPRMHVAAVIVSVQVLGQASLGFDVSIAQILVTLGTAALIEVAVVAVTTDAIAWPASALLTGNGTALILRTPGTVHGDWWSLRGAQVFVAAAAVGVLSKYAVRSRGRHVFNPSNLGLVVVFVVFGSTYADPQDLWWGPWSRALGLTVALILLGGLSLSRRLRTFDVALTFWATFAAGIAVLAASGHAINARWHIGPVTDWSFWWVLVASPEVVIFVFFMITDPRTMPVGRVARRAYAAGVAVLASILAALQRTEFATKVSLLAALTITCAARPWLERWLADDRILGPGSRWVRLGRGGRRVPARPAVAVLAAVAVVAAGAVVVAGRPRRHVRSEQSAAIGTYVAGARPDVHLPPGSVPQVLVAPALHRFSGVVDRQGAQRIGADVVADLAIEGDAVGHGDPSLAATALFGERLDQVRARIAAQRGAARVSVPSYDVRQAEVVLLRDPVSPQALPQLGLLVRGTEDTIVRAASADGSGRVLDQRSTPFDALYLVTDVDGHALIGRLLPPDSPMVVGGAHLPRS